MVALGPDLWAYIVLAVALVAAAVTDLRSGKIYNWTTYPAILIGLFGHLIGGWVVTGEWGGAMFGRPAGIGPGGVMDVTPVMGFGDAVFGLLVGFIPLWLAWRAGGIGGGDAKIMGAVGALAGWRFALASMFCGFAVAILMGLWILVRRQLLKDTFARLGRFVVLWLLRSKPGSPDTEQSPKLPFGTALCIGSAVVLVLVALFGAGRTFPILGI